MVIGGPCCLTNRLLDCELHEGNYPVLLTVVFLVVSVVSGTSRLLIIAEWVKEGMMAFIEHVKYCGPGYVRI